MPFDDLRQKLRSHNVIPVDPFTEIGLVPVSPTIVAEHMRAVAVAYSRTKNPRPTHWHTVYYEDWQANTIQSARRRGKSAASLSLRTFLANPVSDRDTTDLSGAPKALVDLTEKVVRQVEGAAISVEYFDTDPIIYATKDTTTVCLGIWDNGKVVAIAGMPSDAVSETAVAAPGNWLSRLFNFR